MWKLTLISGWHIVCISFSKSPSLTPRVLRLGNKGPGLLCHQFIKYILEACNCIASKVLSESEQWGIFLHFLSFGSKYFLLLWKINKNLLGVFSFCLEKCSYNQIVLWKNYNGRTSCSLCVLSNELSQVRLFYLFATLEVKKSILVYIPAWFSL